MKGKVTVRWAPANCNKENAGDNVFLHNQKKGVIIGGKD